MTVTVTIAAVNDAPVAAADEYTTDEDTPLVVGAPGVLANDTDVDGDALAASSASDPDHGSVALNADGSFTYTPDENDNGLDSFTYEVCDGELCDTGTVTITVNAVNDLPVVVDDDATVVEDDSVDIDVLGNDSDVEGLEADTVTVVFGPDNGHAAVDEDGMITYEPTDDFFGTDSFTYEVCDTDGACDSAVVSVTVTSVNDPVSAVADASMTDEDTPVEIDAAANDSAGPANEAQELEVSLDVPPSHGSVAIVDNVLVYTPEVNFNGSDSFVYQVCDTGDGADDPVPSCATATVSITVNAVNDLPVVRDDDVEVDEDDVVVIDVLANDEDVEGLVSSTVTVTSAPSNGDATVEPDGTITYEPDDDFNGTDSFTYQVCDTDGACDTAVVTVTINPVNDAPIARNDSVRVEEGRWKTIRVLSNDSDVDGDLDPTSVTVVPGSGPTRGTLINNGDGTFRYRAYDDDGRDRFTYEVCDLGGLCDTAVVTIRIDDD